MQKAHGELCRRLWLNFAVQMCGVLFLGLAVVLVVVVRSADVELVLVVFLNSDAYRFRESLVVA